MSVWNQTPHVFESVSKSESWAAAERVQLHIYIEAVTVNTESASRGQMKTTEDGRAVFTLSPHNDCWTESTRRSGRLKCKCSAMEAGWRTELWLENAQRSNLFISWFQRRLIEAASSDFLYVTVQHTHTHTETQTIKQGNWNPSRHTGNCTFSTIPLHASPQSSVCASGMNNAR